MLDLLVEIPNTSYQLNIINDPKLQKLFHKLGFKLLIPRVIIDATKNYDELTKEEILDNNTRKTERPPLQKNTIYCSCELRRHVEDCSIIIKLSKTENTNKVTVRCPTTYYGTDNYHDIQIDVYKNIKFESGEKEIGWYNTDNNILWLNDIGYFPELTIETFEFFLSSIYQFLRTGYIDPLVDLQIGCDLEFELFDKFDNFIPANEYLDDIQGRNNKLGKEIGLDGHSATGEIRPQAADNPIKLSNNVKRTVKKLIHTITMSNPDLKIFCGGGIAEYLGGHIHFNIKNFDINDAKLKHTLYDLIGWHIKNGMQKVSVRIGMNKYMHRDAEDGFRITDSHPGMEWRVPPSFILNDTICRAILCTTWCVIKEYYGNGFPSFDATALPEVINTLRSMRLYPYYSHWIEKFIDIFIVRKTSMEGKDIKNEWGIRTHPYKIIVSTDILWIREYFNSVIVDIDNTIKIGIFNQRDANRQFCISTVVKLSKALQDKLKSFAEDHLIAIDIISEKGNRNSNDITLYIPWVKPPNSNVAFSKLRTILLDIIIEVNNKLSAMKDNVKPTKKPKTDDPREEIRTFDEDI